VRACVRACTRPFGNPCISCRMFCEIPVGQISTCYYNKSNLMEKSEN